MKLFRIKAHQVMANYRKPMSYNFVDSYPLPPISTIKGWFHTVIGAKDYIPISMSIQGISSSVAYDLQKMIKFDRIRKKEKIDQIILPDFKKALSQSPTYVANLFETDLIIYLLTDHEHITTFQENLFTTEYPHIGRNEDLTRIDSMEWVEVQEKAFGFQNAHTIDYGIYINRSKGLEMGLDGLNFRMPFKYEIKNDIRYFNRLDIMYIENGVPNGECLYDEKENRIIDLIGDYHGSGNLC